MNYRACGKRIMAMTIKINWPIPRISARLYGLDSAGRNLVEHIRDCISPSSDTRHLGDEPYDEELWVLMQDLDSNGRRI